MADLRGAAVGPAWLTRSRPGKRNVHCGGASPSFIIRSMKKARPVSIPADSRPGPDQAGAARVARGAEVLAELMELGLEMARMFQAQAMTTGRAGDLDRAVVAEASFNRMRRR